MSTSKNTAFDDIKSLNLSCKNLIAKFGRQALEAKAVDFTDPEVRVKANDLVNVIARDAAEFNERISKLEEIHEKWPAVPKRLSHYSKALDIGGQYVNIIEDITGTMGPAGVELTSLVADQIAESKAALLAANSDEQTKESQ